MASIRPIRHCRDDQGVVAVIVGLTLTALVLAGAMVLDFGLVRLDRQMNKSAADQAATAGAQVLDAAGTDNVRPFRGACAALTFLKASHSRLGGLTGAWTNGAGGAVGADPCAPTSPDFVRECVADTPSSWAWFRGQLDGIRVEIKSGYRLSDGGWAEESLISGDDSAKGGCDQVAVILEQTRTPGLGKLATDADLVSAVRSVARIMPPGPPEDPVGLLILERNNCTATQLNGTNTRILVKGAGEAPGRIHSDSLGNGTGAGSNCGTGSQIINSDTSLGVVAGRAPVGGAPGKITVYALSGAAGARPDKAFDPPDQVVAEGSPGDRPSAGDMITRKVVDDHYRQGVQQAISQATAAWGTAPQPGDRVVTHCTDATNSSVTAALAHTGTVYFNCPTNGPGSGPINYGAELTFAADKVITNTGIKMSGTASGLNFPNAKRIYVAGLASPITGLDVGARIFRVNHGGLPGETCPDGERASNAQVVIGRGQLSASNGAKLQMCNVTVISMGDGTAAAASGCVPVTVALEPQASTPCDAGGLVANGGAMEWTAPNVTMGVASDAQRLALEDLAFWTESAATGQGLGGSASMHLGGVFMLPNANFSLNGGSGQSIENSQYIVRRITATGGATLVMAPDPNNSVPIPPPREIALVR